MTKAEAARMRMKQGSKEERRVEPDQYAGVKVSALLQLLRSD